MNTGRMNSGTGRTQVFGYGSIQGKGFGEFANNFKHPELYEALLKFGKYVVPDYIPFTAIQVNHNYKTKKHIDKKNIGPSLAVSFGDFTGGELVVNGKEYQTKEYPLIFNGALSAHYNKPIKGDRYSLVYFVSAPTKYSDEEVFKLHKSILSKIKLAKGEGLMSGKIDKEEVPEANSMAGSGFTNVLRNGRIEDGEEIQYITKSNEIWKYSDLNQVRKMADKYLGKKVPVYLSTKKDKKFMVVTPERKVVHFGQMKYEDFTRHKDEERRQAYLKRATKIKGDWKQDKYSPNNLAINILW